MKKLFIIFLSLSFFAFCESGKIKTKQFANVREKPSIDSKVIYVLSQNTEVEYINVDCDYVKIEIIEGADKEDKISKVGLIGWVWSKKVDQINNIIIDSGVWLRSDPIKKDNIIGSVKPNAKIKILEKKITWYQLKDGNWVSSVNI